MEYVSYDDPYDEENDCPLDEENDSPNNEEKDAHNEENEITRGITIMKKVIRARDKGIKYENFPEGISPCLLFLSSPTYRLTAEKSKEIGNEVITSHESATSKKKIQTPKLQQVNKSKVVGPSNTSPKKGLAKTKPPKLSPTNDRPPLPTNDHPPVSLLSAYISDTYSKNCCARKLFFAPLYFDNYGGGHWVLVVIDAVSEIVYYLDPFLGDPNSHPNMKKFLNTVLQKFRSLRGARVQRSKLNNISWIRIQCPRQRNSIDCGYFVMGFMKEIVISNKIEIPVSYFDDFKCPTYSKDKLTEIKEEWS
ncbi:hypothetical protein P8452_56855 [Trifolium repens]|nr:hypothetical protein P8452_56855 [Trifolium repens]